MSQADVTFDDLSLSKYGLTERAKRLKDIYFDAIPELCIERASLVTRFSHKNDLLDQDRISILDKARMYRYVLSERAPVVWHPRAYKKRNGWFRKSPKGFKISDDNLFAGCTTNKFRGAPLYPEFAIALTLWPELWSISTRKSNPFQLSKKDGRELNSNIFPHWMEKNVLEIARERCFKENLEKHGKEKCAPELELFHQMVFFTPAKAGCISHTIPHLSTAIDKGLGSIISDAEKRGEKTSDPARKEFYQAVAEAMRGVIDYSNNLADEAERMAEKERKPKRRKELLEIAEINRRVPEHPARTFREGLTTVWICWVAIHTENRNFAISTGRMDQYLYDLYRNDIDDGVITVEDAIELLCCLWLKIGDHVPTVPDAAEQLFGGTGSNQAITIGGVDENGKDAVNDLTYVILRAIELMQLRDPNLNARYYPGENPPEYLTELCRVNISTGATPAIHNDKAVIKALTGKDDTVEQARDYGIIGCVEPGSSGRSYGHSAALLLNLTSALELAMFSGRHRHTRDLQINEETGDPGDFQTFDEFKAAFEKQTRWLVKQTTNLNNIMGKVCQDFQSTPILSALFEGPMEKGKCLEEGGAIINSSGATIIGLADVSDSLSAIQKVVFEDGVPFSELLDALKADFEGHKSLHQKLLAAPKYGNEDPVADANTTWLVELLDKAFWERKNYRGGRYRVGYWTMTNHAGFGRIMESTPNGRKKGANFTSGITPVSGVTPCLSKALNSVANLPAERIPSSFALNLKYTPENNEDTLDRFVASVEAYFDNDNGKRDGGMEIQFNVTDLAKFKRVQEDPKSEEAREFLVRVSGYTAYFKDLNPQMQDEIIERTEYKLSTGKMVKIE